MHGPSLSALGAALLTICPMALAEPGVLQELWREIPGDSVRDLTASPRYGQLSDALRVLPSFSAGDLGANYGARWSALLAPPSTGDYTFWIASDDSSELWLSPDQEEAGLRLVARVDGYTEPEAWDAQPGQRSRPVRLEAGRRYAIRALHKQGGGGNHLAVAWGGPGLERAIVGSEYLVLPQLGEVARTRLAETRRAEEEQAELLQQAEPYWTRGETMPVELARRFTLTTEAPPANDTGINLLLDQAHQTQFAVLWGMRGALQEAGFRACTSVASLGSVLTPGSPCRVRLSVAGMEPFGWWPAAEWNVVVTSQQDLEAQPYTEEERQALLGFVEAGGGLLVFGAKPATPDAAAAWSLNDLLRPLGAAYTSTPETAASGTWSALGLDAEWETLLRGDSGRPVRARRTYGAGRVLLAEGSAPLNPGGEEPADVQAAKRAALRDAVTWVAGGRAPVGGDYRIPEIGGVGIYPELERNLGEIVVYYAANQKPDVVRCITENVPRAAEQIRAWFPTPLAAEPYNIVICAGGGGGWAINARPKAAAVIDYDPLSLLGVFAHEMAHTMPGPPNAQGEHAAFAPHGNQGEAHAGWFQGKVLAMFSPELRDQSNRNCNSILDLEREKGDRVDLATEYENEAGRAVWGYGGSWTKTWWVFQKLDDRYGPTWYPRWYWVRSTRWAAEPGHQETWDEMAEDMSIAVGEDLFPFLRAAGTTLTRERLERIEFQGRTLELPVAPIDQGPGGNVCLDPIGDYREPLAPRP
jgi:hypothetical protein